MKPKWWEQKEPEYHLHDNAVWPPIYRRIAYNPVTRKPVTQYAVAGSKWHAEAPEVVWFASPEAARMAHAMAPAPVMMYHDDLRYAVLYGKSYSWVCYDDHGVMRTERIT